MVGTTTMKSILLAAALALGAGASQAQIRPLIGTGITYGGETLAEVTYNNGWTEKIKSGGLVALYGGVEFYLGDVVAMQATVGYHIDNSSGRNASLRFSRYPIDLVALVRVAPNVRIGAGVQYVDSAKLAGSGDLSGIRVDYKASTGGIVEGEYLFWPNFGVQVRGVVRKYQATDGSPSVSGNHLGVMVNYYF